MSLIVIFMCRFIPFVVALVVNAGAWAQLKPVTPQAAYEGQNVTAIDLTANPHRDVEPLRIYLVQKPGEPYSQGKVEASLSALREKGGFPKVEVNVVPDISGLRLNFLLEPAYFIGVVE